MHEKTLVTKKKATKRGGVPRDMRDMEKGLRDVFSVIRKRLKEAGVNKQNQ